MAESLKNNDKNVRSYILNNVLEKVPIDKSHENLCKVIGKDTITFYDFQYWYYRFKDGKHDLDVDRSSEPEPLQFSALPIDTVGLFVDKLKWADKLMLRHVSKQLRDYIENQEIDCKSIDVSCRIDLISLGCGDERIVYAKNDKILENYENDYYIQGGRKVFECNYESKAFNDLALILKNPKLQLEKFSFYYDISSQMRSEKDIEMVERCRKRIENDVLKPLKHQVAVKDFTIHADSPDNVLAILPYLKPGRLEIICINKLKFSTPWNNTEYGRKIQKIVSLDQWKLANGVELNYLLEFFPDHGLTYFKSLFINDWEIETGTLFRLRDIFIKSKTLECCILNTRLGFKPKKFEIGVPGPPTRHTTDVRHCMIPDSNQYVEFQFHGYCKSVTIVKETRQ